MSTLLLTDIHILLTMNTEDHKLADAAVLIRDDMIEFVGTKDQIPSGGIDETISLKNYLVMPGMVNTHHHMYQSLTRVIAQDNELFDWLITLYPIWAGLTGEMAYISAKVAIAELILSGCTTSSDHLYIFPHDVLLDDTIQAAQEIGMRFHPTRGSMSVGESKGGLPPDSLVEEEDAILKDTQRLIEAYHEPERYGMVRVGVAPCSPFSVSQDLMRESAMLARSYNVRLHTHLAENNKDITYSQEVFGLTPGDYAQDVGWIGDDVWHAHCVKLNADEIKLFGQTGTGICHCPCSNMRLASGIAPIREMLDHNVKVGLGVDGSASNDAAHLLNEARTAMLLQRVGGNPAALTAHESLKMATRGGASVLGRDDIGMIAPGMSADIVAYKLDDIAFSGAQHDPIAALLFCGSKNVDLSIINGKVIVKNGQILTVDLPVLIERHNKLSYQLING